MHCIIEWVLVWLFVLVCKCDWEISNWALRVWLFDILILNFTYVCFFFVVISSLMLTKSHYLHILIVVIYSHVRKQFKRSGKLHAITFSIVYSFIIFLKRISFKMSKMITQNVLNGICFNETRETTILTFICKYLSEILMLRLESEWILLSSHWTGSQATSVDINKRSCEMMYSIELSNFAPGFKHWNIIPVATISNYVIISYRSCTKNHIYNPTVLPIICFIYFQTLGYLP